MEMKMNKMKTYKLQKKLQNITNKKTFFKNENTMNMKKIKLMENYNWTKELGQFSPISPFFTIFLSRCRKTSWFCWSLLDKITMRKLGKSSNRKWGINYPHKSPAPTALSTVPQKEKEETKKRRTADRKKKQLQRYSCSYSYRYSNCEDCVNKCVYNNYKNCT